jgi:outer membrane protein assembly factor BamB
MDQIEQETPKVDPAIEVTDLPPDANTKRRSQEQATKGVATREVGNIRNVATPLVDVGARKIWHNWRLITAGGILVLLLTAIIPIRNQWNQLNRPTSAQAALTPTPTPIISPWWSGHDVSLTIVNGIAYVGSVDGVVSALRINDGTLLWSHTTNGSSTEPLVLNGIVYTSTNPGNGPGHLYALHANNGALLWSYTGSSFLFVPTVVDGIAYVHSEDGTISALRASDGALLWHYKLNGPAFDTPTVTNSILYISSENKTLYALRASDGALLWLRRLDGHIFASPTIVNGVAYVGLEEGPVYALQASNGSPLWHYAPAGGEFVPPLVINGVVYLGTTEMNTQTATIGHAGYSLQTYAETIPAVPKNPFKEGISSIYALSATDGTLLWHRTLYNNGSDNDAAWLTIVNGAIYLGTFINQSRGYVYALRATDGSLLWRYPTEDPAVNALVANGIAYLVSSDGTVYALRTTNGALLWHYTIIGPVVDKPILVGDSVYVGAANGVVYALQATTGVLRWYYLTKTSN